MSKMMAALIAGLFAVSASATFAADAPKAAEAPAKTEKPAAPAKKADAAKKHDKKAEAKAAEAKPETK